MNNEELIMKNEKYKCFAFDVGACIARPQINKSNAKGITLIAFAISRKCVRYEERAWKPCERREKERKV